MIWYTIWLFNIAMEHHGKSHFLTDKPSISMGHLYHGYVSHNLRVYVCLWSDISVIVKNIGNKHIKKKNGNIGAINYSNILIKHYHQCQVSSDSDSCATWTPPWIDAIEFLAGRPGWTSWTRALADLINLEPFLRFRTTKLKVKCLVSVLDFSEG